MIDITADGPHTTRFLFHFDEDIVNPNRSKQENRTAKKPAYHNRRHLNKSSLDATLKIGE